MKSMVLLDYTFMFDPVETWQHLYQFEQDLSKFFIDNGMDIQIVKSVDGQNGKRVLVLQKKPMAPDIQPPEQSKSTSIQNQTKIQVNQSIPVQNNNPNKQLNPKQQRKWLMKQAKGK